MNKMGLKIIALGCILLIISGLFLPFVSVNGYTTTLFDGNVELNYYPYILIGFSLLSVIVILLNKKIEFAYLLIGSSLTFVLTTTIGSIENFKSFSIGYYLIAVSTVLLFLILVLLGMKVKDKIVVNSEEEIKSVDDNINFDNVEPTELAKSIMSEPVMNNLGDISELNSNISNEPKIDFNDITSEEVTLAPQNPLNSFLPSDFDPNKIIKEEQNNIQIDDTVEKKVEQANIPVKENNQSIMSVMSQPMVNTNLNSSPIVEPQPMNIPEIQPQINSVEQQPLNSVPQMNTSVQEMNMGQNVQSQPLNNTPIVEPQANMMNSNMYFNQNNNQ